MGINSHLNTAEYQGIGAKYLEHLGYIFYFPPAGYAGPGQRDCPDCWRPPQPIRLAWDLCL